MYPEFYWTQDQVCTVGDLLPGQRYRTPDGGERMVVTPDATDGYKRVVDVTTGEIMGASPDTNLGHDQAGRLYASRSLNPTPMDTAS